MVSVVARNLRKERRTQGSISSRKTLKSKINQNGNEPLEYNPPSPVSQQRTDIFVIIFILDILFAALFELFDKADTGGDGTISIDEYVAMCDEYGIELTEDHLESVRAVANKDGEVTEHRNREIFLLS